MVNKISDPSISVLLTKNIADLIFLQYSALVTAGFNHDEAMKITVAVVLKSNK